MIIDDPEATRVIRYSSPTETVVDVYDASGQLIGVEIILPSTPPRPLYPMKKRLKDRLAALGLW